MNFVGRLNSRAEKVYIELIKVLLLRSKRAVYATLFISLLIFVFIFRISSHSPLVYWIFAQMFLGIIRLITVSVFVKKGRNLTFAEAKKYETFSIFFASFAGLLSGSIALFPVPESHLLHFFTFTSFVIGGMVAGGVTMLAPSIKSLVPYSFFILAPLVARFLSTSEGLYHLLAFFIILFGISLTYIGFENGKNLKLDLNNKFFNRKLFHKLLYGNKQLETSNNYLEGILNHSSNALYVIDEKTNFIHVNPSLSSITGYKKSELLGMKFLDIFDQTESAAMELDIQNVLKGKTPIRHSEVKIFRKDGEPVFINFSLSPLKITRKKIITGAVGTAENITEIKISQIFQAGRIHVMDLLTQNAELDFIFNQIIKTAQEIYHGSIASILLLDEKKSTIKIGSAPDLPDFYNNAVNGLKIGPNVGSCGAAMYSGAMVIAEDIFTHPNWEPYREITQKAGLRACWSEPIKGRKILGSFAIYYKTPRSPNSLEIELIKELAGIAKIAIEKKQMEKELEKKNNELDFLHEISSHANQARELCDLFTGITNSLVKLEKIGLDNSIKVFTRENNFLNLVYSTETVIEQDYCKKIEIGQCLCGLSAKSNELIISENAMNDERHTITNPEDEPVHGHVVVPLRVKNEVSGILCLYSKVKEFKEMEDYEQMFLTAGNHIGEAISRKKLYQEVKNLSLKDSLTGLANRRKMNEFIDHIFATSVRFENDLSIIIFDIDHFKDYNDTHGHAQGDIILKKIGNLLTSEGRESDLHIRYGGEEFLVILPQTPVDTAAKFAERIHKNIHKETGVTVSIGIAELNAIESFEDLLKRADNALYKAKANGRNRIERA
jgi:diguanylate cyclase (GGDEF)-like protein/PAS domain S-box-containing protein